MTSTEHFILAEGENGDRWVIVRRSCPEDRWNLFNDVGGSLEARVGFLLETLRVRPGADLTFSTRTPKQVVDGFVEDAAAVRTAVPGASLSILAPLSPASDANKWGTAWRDPTNRLTAGQHDTRFRTQVLLDVVREWFLARDWRSFRPAHPREQNDAVQVSRPGFARELLVRHDWTIADVMAEPASASPVAATA